MKKQAIAALVASFVIASTIGGAWPAAHAHAASNTAATLSEGAYGDAVTQLQTDLQTLGYFTSARATGYFGDVTAQALAGFQRDYGLTASGQDDEQTQTAIEHALVKKKLLADAARYKGTRYVWGGTTPNPGFDCSGFVYFMFKKYGIDIDRSNSAKQYTMGTKVSRADLMPGDLVFFSTHTPGKVNHVGIYIGNNQFISATNSKGIAVNPIDSGYWGSRYIGAKRVY